MGWIHTTPTEAEKTFLPEIGSHWINKKIEKAIAANKPISQKTKNALEIIVTGANCRDDETEDSLQVNYCLAVDPARSNIFMEDFASFHEKYRLKIDSD